VITRLSSWVDMVEGCLESQGEVPCPLDHIPTVHSDFSPHGLAPRDILHPAYLHRSARPGRGWVRPTDIERLYIAFWTLEVQPMPTITITRKYQHLIDEDRTHFPANLDLFGSRGRSSLPSSFALCLWLRPVDSRILFEAFLDSSASFEAWDESHLGQEAMSSRVLSEGLRGSFRRVLQPLSRRQPQ
jgi:hypothetical protein